MTWLGPWSLPEEVFGFLRKNLAEGSTIVELGSGEGTAKLVQHWNVYSIEHNPEYLGLYGSHYIHAPLVDLWYDPEAVRAGLPETYDCLIVDGPPQNLSRRRRLLKFIEMFKPCRVIVDDISHDHGRDIVVALADLWKPKHYSVHILQPPRGFATLGWDDL